MLHRRHGFRLVQFHADRFRQRLLAGEDDGMLGGGVEVGSAKLRGLGARRLQQVADDAVDAHHFLAHVLEHIAGRAFLRQVAPDNVHDAGNAGQGVADFVGESGGQLAQGGKVLGAGHLGVVQALDFGARLAQLRHHLVKVAAQLADVVGASGKANGDVEVAVAHALDFVLQLPHGSAEDQAERKHQHGADGNGADRGH